MTDLVDALRRLRAGRDGLPPFLENPPEGMLSVARELFEHPETVTLPDGRELGYAETGDPEGDPVLAFHGVPSGRLGAAVFNRAAASTGAGSSPRSVPASASRIPIPTGP